VKYGPTCSETRSLNFRRSLYITQDLQKGDMLTRENIRAIRPGLGLPPKYLEELLGKKIIKAVKRGTPMDWSLLA
jgi:N-acetylneuraminate synthase